MKIIFLDIDGVINTGKQRLKLKKINNNIDDWDYNNIFCKQSLENLYKITAITNSDIILHTSRRFADSLLVPLKYQFMEYGIYNRILGTTPRLNENDVHSRDRELEIIQWFDDNPIEKFVILDDDQGCFKQLRDNLIVIDSMEGITDSVKQLAVKMLS